MDRRPTTSAPAGSQAAGDLEIAARIRRERDWSMSMSERLARMHRLCKQMTQIKGSARRQ